MKKLFIFIFIIIAGSNISFAEVALTNNSNNSDQNVLGQIKANTVSHPRSYGYKNFKWGMSLDEVRSLISISILPVADVPRTPENRITPLTGLANIVNGATVFWFPRFKDLLQFGDNDEALSNGLFLHETGVGTLGYTLAKAGNDYVYNFYFIDDALVAVSVGFCFDRYNKVLSEIKAKYGKASQPTTLLYTSHYCYEGPKDYDISYTAWAAKGKVVVLNNSPEFPAGQFPYVTYIDINWYYKRLKSFIAENKDIK